jgi:hypothetical protein
MDVYIKPSNIEPMTMQCSGNAKANADGKMDIWKTNGGLLSNSKNLFAAAETAKSLPSLFRTSRL